MAETHILQNVVPFLLAIWWSKHYLTGQLISRWRFVLASLIGAILWIYVAFTATRGIDPSDGVSIVFGSTAFAYFAGFMAFVSVVSIFLGLLLWTEEAADETGVNSANIAKTQLQNKL